MARTARFRSKGSPFTGGSVDELRRGAVVGTVQPNRTGYTSFCSDWIGQPVGDSSFDSAQYTGVYPYISGSAVPTPIIFIDEVRFNAFTCAALPSALVDMEPLPPPNGWMLDLVAGTNPSRPVLNIPEAIENIVSLPRMVKSLGDLIMSPASKMKPKGFAGEYLGVQFGWRPLIDDLTKLLDLQSYVLKRNRELSQLYSGKGSRRRLKFADDTATSVHTAGYPFGVISVVTQSCSLTVKREQWATIRWYPTSPPPYHPDDIRWNALSTQLVLGATPEAMLNGIWKVIPWTWLIGWFTNFGKYTLANSWTIPADHGAGCFMTKAEGTYSSAGVSVTNATDANISHGGKATRTVRRRHVSSTVTVGANMPYLDMFRLSILSALFVQRFLK